MAGEFLTPNPGAGYSGATVPGSDRLPRTAMVACGIVHRGKRLRSSWHIPGSRGSTAARVARQVMSDQRVALDTMAREELGLDPDDLGSPWRAAAGSFLSFSAGAILIVLPYLVTILALIFTGRSAAPKALGRPYGG